MNNNLLHENVFNRPLKNNGYSFYNVAFQRRYYGARYQDPKTSRWLSTDPALGEYIPGAPINDEVRKRNGNLPGMGGVFNTVNLHLYHYAGNNPVKYLDPDGKFINAVTSRDHQNSSTNNNLNIGSGPTGFYKDKVTYIANTVGRFGCLFVAAVNIGNSVLQAMGQEPKNLSDYSSKDKYFDFFLAGPGVGLGTDFASGSGHIASLLKDMTGKSFDVARYRNSEVSTDLIKSMAKSRTQNAYMIGAVDGHFINITGIDDKGNLTYHDPFDRSAGKPKDYKWEDIKGVYLITESVK